MCVCACVLIQKFQEAIRLRLSGLFLRKCSCSLGSLWLPGPALLLMFGGLKRGLRKLHVHVPRSERNFQRVSEIF